MLSRLTGYSKENKVLAGNCVLVPSSLTLTRMWQCLAKSLPWLWWLSFWLIST